jgi:hypothetical protein
MGYEILEEHVSLYPISHIPHLTSLLYWKGDFNRE